MKRKKLIIGIILGIVVLTLIGNKIYVVYEENEAKKALLEWLYSVEPEKVIKGVIIDERKGPYEKDHIYTDMTETHKVALCQAMQSISVDEISALDNNFTDDYLTIWFDAFVEERRTLCKFNGEAVYVFELPEDIKEQTGYRGWEIRNDKINEFLEGVLE